jgi:uncharacterized protein YegP (UPF0339 family)
MINKGTNKDLEEFKYLIDSRNLSDKEKNEERDAIIKARADRFKERSVDFPKEAKLMQLKIQMRDYLSEVGTFHKSSFSKFLRIYSDILFDKRKEFALDMSIEPMSLSHILNGRREPNDTFLMRLIDHSQNSFKKLGGFDKTLWPMIFYRDKVNILLDSLGKRGTESKKRAGIRSPGKFEIKTDKSGQFRFNLKAGNGQVILVSEAYTTKAACEKGIESVRINSQFDKRYDTKTAKDGSPFFNLKAANGQIIAASEMYSSKTSMFKGISSVKKNAPKAKIIDRK